MKCKETMLCGSNIFIFRQNELYLFLEQLIIHANVSLLTLTQLPYPIRISYEISGNYFSTLF